MSDIANRIAWAINRIIEMEATRGIERVPTRFAVMVVYEPEPTGEISAEGHRLGVGDARLISNISENEYLAALLDQMAKRLRGGKGPKPVEEPMIKVWKQ